MPTISRKWVNGCMPSSYNTLEICLTTDADVRAELFVIEDRRTASRQWMVSGESPERCETGEEVQKNSGLLKLVERIVGPLCTTRMMTRHTVTHSICFAVVHQIAGGADWNCHLLPREVGLLTY